ncbi:MAG: ATP synthase F1 subunit epsilon [Lachnospirales bacterium]
MAKLSLKIITPNRIMYDGEADMVIMRTKTGDVGILKGHQPMVTVLDYGVLTIQNSGEEDKKAAVFGGFAEVNSKGLSVFTDVAEWSNEIDMARAEAAKERAEAKLRSGDSTLDISRASLALRRALIRLNINK